MCASNHTYVPPFIPLSLLSSLSPSLPPSLPPSLSPSLPLSLQAHTTCQTQRYRREIACSNNSLNISCGRGHIIQTYKFQERLRKCQDTALTNKVYGIVKTALPIQSPLLCSVVYISIVKEWLLHVYIYNIIYNNIILYSLLLRSRSPHNAQHSTSVSIGRFNYIHTFIIILYINF